MNGKRARKLRKAASVYAEQLKLSSSTQYKEADSKRVLVDPVSQQVYGVVNGQRTLSECERKLYKTMKEMV
ncbi:MAG: hypothetical protein ACRCVU_13775 [Flavobacterium sp.]